MSETELQTRPGLPDDLRVLLARYPREDWQAHENLGGMAQFWLERHAMFRDLGGMLNGAVGDWREGRVETTAFVQFFVPRLNFFLGQLEGHHQIEDHHYFPQFIPLDARLEQGFALLDNDHHALDGHIHALADTTNAVLRRIAAGEDDEKEARALLDAQRAFRKFLHRHLDDEEDLVVPVILEYGPALG